MPTLKSIRFRLCLLVCFCLILLPAAPSSAASPASLTNQGNKAYAAADYKKALNLYQQAAQKEKGDSAIIDYDRGNALYRLNDFDGARKLYEKAAQNHKDSELAARSYYNMGNAAYRQGETLSQQAPDKALTSFTESAAAYREALRMAPQISGAGSNLELANMRIKALTAQLQQQQGGAGEQKNPAGPDKQGKGKDSQSLQDLADRQKQLADRTEKLQNGQQGKKEQQKAAGALAEDQQLLRQKTEEKMQQADKQKEQGSGDLKSAAELQRKAGKKLRAADLQQAAELQKQAAEKLKKAAEKSRQHSTDKKQDSEKKEGTGDRQGEKSPGQRNRDQADDNRPAAGDNRDQSAPPPELDPRELLNQEKMHLQLRRQRMISSGSRQAEKDW